MSQDWIEGMCNETSGFLFRHPCTQFAQDRCGACGKPLCEEHTRRRPGSVLCPACDCAEARRLGETTPRHRDHDDTYYHGTTYYSGYGYYGSRPRTGSATPDGGGAGNDPNDFQAGDAESLRNEADEEFETDMSES